MDALYDLVIVGGGINGAAVARDAAGRGASVMLVERDDLAAHTSSASTKLIHGGLRYLEQYEFRLVDKALRERERLMNAAPHLVRPLQFVLPHNSRMRPAWVMRMGLLIYDMLGGKRSLPRSRAVRLDRGAFGDPLQSRFRKGFSYFDCWGDDSRLVIANAQSAAEKGAEILTRTECAQARRHARRWEIDIQPREGQRRTVHARCLVNATGAWAADFQQERAQIGSGASLRLIKGSHIVTRRLFSGSHAYILQNPDGRIVFAIPYEDDFTLIGTTDVDWQGDPGRVVIEQAEIDYLCESANRWLHRPIGPEDVVWTFAGIRPLHDDEAPSASEISRDYVLSLDANDGLAPILSIYGGKITTHRALGEDALDRLAPLFPEFGPAWTGTCALPGGDLDGRGLAGLTEDLARAAPFLETGTVSRLACSYGSRAFRIIEGAKQLSDLGESYGAGLTRAEVDYLVAHEWARTSEDVLWRRSKLGLHMTAEEISRFTQGFGYTTRTTEASRTEAR